MNLGAIITAMVTPFDSAGEVDEPATVRLLQHLFSHGSDGVVVCGTTGEATTLDDEEHRAMIELVVSETRANHPGKSVIAGVGSNDTRHAVSLTGRCHGAAARRAACGQPVLQHAHPGAGSSRTSPRSIERPTCRSSSTTSPSAPAPTCPTT